MLGVPLFSFSSTFSAHRDVFYQRMQVLTNKQTIKEEFVVGKINEDETEFMVLEKNEENKIINLLN